MFPFLSSLFFFSLLFYPSFLYFLLNVGGVGNDDPYQAQELSCWSHTLPVYRSSEFWELLFFGWPTVLTVNISELHVLPLPAQAQFVRWNQERILTSSGTLCRCRRKRKEINTDAVMFATFCFTTPNDLICGFWLNKSFVFSQNSGNAMETRHSKCRRTAKLPNAVSCYQVFHFFYQ